MNFYPFIGRRWSISPFNFLFPRRCAACRSALFPSEQVMCALCETSLLPLDGTQCPRCATADSAGRYCPSCTLDPPPFSKTYAAFFYGGSLAQAVQRLKYEDAPWVARALALLTLEAAPREIYEAFEWCDAVVPIPLHPTRLVLRGYNQAALFAHALTDGFSTHWNAECPLVDDFALARIHATKAQVGQAQQARLKNLKDAFEANPQRVRGKKILLVDDVMTTGATCQEATFALLKAGASEIRVFCLARTLFCVF